MHYFYGTDEKRNMVYFYGTDGVLVLNEMWVEWVSARWDHITIYGKSEPSLLFADGLKWKNKTPIRERRKIK